MNGRGMGREEEGKEEGEMEGRGRGGEVKGEGRVRDERKERGGEVKGRGGGGRERMGEVEGSFVFLSFLRFYVYAC